MCGPHIRTPLIVRPATWVRTPASPTLGEGMCGIAGLFSKSPELSEGLGGHLGEMLLQLSDRGPDSAGVAFYRDPAPAGSSKVSLFSPDPKQNWTRVGEA